MTLTHTAGRRVGVLFNDVVEFLNELAADIAAHQSVERGIVRVTYRERLAGSATIKRIYVVAGYAEQTTGRPVQLEQYVGDDWGEGFPGREQTYDRAREIRQRIEGACRSAGLQTRGGAFAEIPPATFDVNDEER